MRVVILTVVIVILLAPTTLAWGQETPTPSPSPTEEETFCPIGQVCTDIKIDRPSESGPVHDPAGNYIRSLITIGAIAMVIGAYLFFAFGWVRFFSRSRRGEGRS